MKMKKYDKLIITAERKVINAMMGIVSIMRRHDITVKYNGSALIIPKEYDFVKVKRRNCRDTKKRLKNQK